MHFTSESKYSISLLIRIIDITKARTVKMKSMYENLLLSISYEIIFLMGEMVMYFIG
jgi:hypothetical protein